MAEGRVVYRFQRIIKALLGGLMPKFIDRTGQRFGKLVVLSRMGVGANKKVLWKCRCDCGKETNVVAGALVTGNTTSCGCYLQARITKHGGWKKASYNTWRAMMRRCTNPNDKDYARYGAKGVKVCPQWYDYLQFERDMGEPTGEETLDRIDPYGGYTPENCRWASLPVQARNIRLHSKNKTGYVGVSEVYEGRWMAKVSKGKKAFYSRVFPTVEEAAAARKELERLHWGVAT
jgi:hypothetical protein